VFVFHSVPFFAQAYDEKQDLRYASSSSYFAFRARREAENGSKKEYENLFLSELSVALWSDLFFVVPPGVRRSNHVYSLAGKGLVPFLW
jgi:hypothetical protein